MKSIRNSLARHPLILETVGALAAVLFFLSWASEKYVFERWRDELARIDKYAFHDGYEMVRQDHYFIWYSQLKRAGGTDEDVINAANSFVVSSYRRLQLQEIALREDHEQPRAAEIDLYERIQRSNELLVARDRNTIERLAEQATTQFEREATKRRDAIKDKIGRIRAQEGRARRLFLGLYIAGALVAAAAFLATRAISKSQAA